MKLNAMFTQLFGLCCLSHSQYQLQVDAISEYIIQVYITLIVIISAAYQCSTGLFITG